MPVTLKTYVGKAVSGCLGFGLAVSMLTACSGSDPEPPTPTATPQVLATPTTAAPVLPPLDGANPTEDTSGMTVEDGYIPDGSMVSPFDVEHPALSNLNVNLLDAVQRAWADANLEGIEMFITSGWRSARYQQFLLDEGIAFYGSEEEARKWVSTPEHSSHVSGNAVDVGPMDAYIWLSERSHLYGLCQTYANEQWHYELAAGPNGECPPQLDDASAGQ